MLKGIDIANPYQPDPLAMSKLKAEGLSFVVQKVTQGVYFDYNPAARVPHQEDPGGRAHRRRLPLPDPHDSGAAPPDPWNQRCRHEVRMRCQRYGRS